MVMKIRRFRLMTLCLACMGTSPALQALEISGSSTVQPVVQMLMPLHAAQGGDAVKLSAGGSGAGVKNASEGKSDIGMVSRDLKAEEKTVLKNTVIGIDALAIIVNKSNPLASLTKAQLVDLYAGRIDNWKALGGPDRPVTLVSKEVGRSTLELFEHYTGLLSPDHRKTDKPLISSKALIIGANMESLILVGGMPGGIGYVSVGTARAMAQAGMPVKILTLEGVDPSDEAIQAKRYPIVRPLNLVYAKESPAVSKFLALALSSQGQEKVKSLGFLPVSQ